MNETHLLGSVYGKYYHMIVFYILITCIFLYLLYLAIHKNNLVEKLLRDYVLTILNLTRIVNLCVRCEILCSQYICILQSVYIKLKLSVNILLTLQLVAINALIERVERMSH